MVERLVRDQEAAGSNPVYPRGKSRLKPRVLGGLFFCTTAAEYAVFKFFSRTLKKAIDSYKPCGLSAADAPEDGYETEYREITLKINEHSGVVIFMLERKVVVSN